MEGEWAAVAHAIDTGGPSPALVTVAGTHGPAKRAIYSTLSQRGDMQLTLADAGMGASAAAVSESRPLLASGGVMCGGKQGTTAALLPTAPDGSIKSAATLAIALMLPGAVLWCTHRAPKRHELLRLLADAAEIASAVHPTRQANPSGGSTALSAPKFRARLTIVLSDVPMSAPLDEESTVLRSLFHIEPTYGIDRDGESAAAEAAATSAMNDLRLAVLDAFGGEAPRAVVLPSMDESHYADRLRHVLDDKALLSQRQSLDSVAVDPSATEIVRRVASIRVPSMSSTWAAEEAAWRVERARAIAAEDFTRHCDVRRGRLTEEYVNAQYAAVMDRCEAMLSDAGVGDMVDVVADGNLSTDEARLDAVAELRSALEEPKTRFLAVAAELAAAPPRPLPGTTSVRITRSSRRDTAPTTAAGRVFSAIEAFAEEHVPHRFRFWFTQTGLVTIGVVLLFLVGAFWSFRAGV